MSDAKQPLVVTLCFEVEAHTPLEAVKAFQRKAADLKHWNYTVENEETGQTFLVDMQTGKTHAA